MEVSGKKIYVFFSYIYLLLVKSNIPCSDRSSCCCCFYMFCFPKHAVCVCCSAGLAIKNNDSLAVGELRETEIKRNDMEVELEEIMDMKRIGM